MAWTEEQIRNANVIATIGRQVGASRRDILTALTAAIVESGLRNVNYGDRDSLGLFQQRAAWGSSSDRTDPAKAAKMFFLGGTGGQRGLLDIHNRDSMSPGAAAQAVQVSAFPDRYQAHIGEAQQLLGGAKYDYTTDTPENDDTLGRVPGLDSMVRDAGQRTSSVSDLNIVDPLGAISADASGLGEQGGMGVGLESAPAAAGALDSVTFDNSAASAQSAPTASSGGGGGGGGGGGASYMADLHMPGIDDLYNQATSGGSDPSLGIDLSGAASGWRQNVVSAAKKMLGTPYVWGGENYGGVDCSGLMKLIFKAQGIDMPHLSASQANMGTRIGLNQLEAGDMVAWDNSSRNNGADHIALYIGDGKIIEAARPGTNVQVSNIYDTGRAWGVRLPQADTPTVGAGPGEWGAQLNVAAAGNKIAKKFGIANVGGYNNRNIAGTNTKSDHAFGLALDFMGGKQDLANYVVSNAQSLNVKYAIYNHHIWSLERADEGWRPYTGENPHTDHVHVSFYGDGMLNGSGEHGDDHTPRVSRGGDRPMSAGSPPAHTGKLNHLMAQADNVAPAPKHHKKPSPAPNKHQHLDSQFDQNH